MKTSAGSLPAAGRLLQRVIAAEEGLFFPGKVACPVACQWPEGVGSFDGQGLSDGQGLRKMPPFAYEMHEMAYLALAPARAVSDAARTWLEHPCNPLSYTAAGRNLAASAKIFERLTRRFDKPAFDLATTAVDGKIVP